jgi:hypothetical protein
VRARWGEGNHCGATVDYQGSCPPEGSVLKLKGTPAKQQLLISIVVIFVTIAAAYFALVSPR